MERAQTKRVKRRTLKTAEVIARDIIEDISDLALETDDVLPPEAAMVEQYGVGRASVREALRLLESYGLVRIKSGPGGGPIVGRATPSNLGRTITLFLRLAGVTYLDVLNTLRVVEPLLAEKAARQNSNRKIIERLRHNVECACINVGDLNQKVSELQAFHQLIYEAAGDRLLSLLTSAIGSIYVEHLVASIDTRPFHDVTIEDHKAIADAIINGQPMVARRLMEDHVDRQIEFIRSQMPGMLSHLVEWR